MPKIWCTHNIAFAVLEPTGQKSVRVSLGGDVRGSTVLPFDPVVLQDWIYATTRLSCFKFDFDAVFAELRQEMETYVATRGELEMQAIRARYAVQVQKARKIRESWQETEADLEHDKVCSKSWTSSSWTVDEEQEESNTTRMRKYWGE